MHVQVTDAWNSCHRWVLKTLIIDARSKIRSAEWMAYDLLSWFISLGLDGVPEPLSIRRHQKMPSYIGCTSCRLCSSCWPTSTVRSVSPNISSMYSCDLLVHKGDVTCCSEEDFNTGLCVVSPLIRNVTNIISSQSSERNRTVTVQMIHFSAISEEIRRHFMVPTASKLRRPIWPQVLTDDECNFCRNPLLTVAI